MNTELNIKNYNIYRADRTALTSSKQIGGGALIAVTSHIHSEVIPTREQGIEQVFVLLKYHHHLLVIGAIYIPPNSPVDIYLRHEATLKEISERHPTADFFLFGDYNLPKVDWTNLDNNSAIQAKVGAAPPVRDAIPVVQGILDYLNLFQINTETNAAGNTLDLVLCPYKDVKLLPIPDIIIPTDIHHPPLYFPFSFPQKSPEINDITLRDFQKGDYQNIVLNLNIVNWEAEFASRNFEDAISFFYSVIRNLIENFVPKKKIFIKIHILDGLIWN